MIWVWIWRPTERGCSTWSSWSWWWWTTNKTKPTIENIPRSDQIQQDSLLRTGRRWSAARRRILYLYLPQFTVKTRNENSLSPILNPQQETPKSETPKIKNWKKTRPLISIKNHEYCSKPIGSDSINQNDGMQNELKQWRMAKWSWPRRKKMTFLSSLNEIQAA